MHCAAACVRRGRRRRRLLLPLALGAAGALGTLLPAGRSDAAAFVPGQVEPDPPTGDVGASRPTPEEPIASGNGVRWQFARWRYGGNLSTDLRWLRQEDGRRATQGVLSGDIDAASYIWQPWFVRVQAGVGFVLGRDASRGGDSPPDTNTTLGLTGRVAVSVFPASRFPFELRLDVSDSRSTGDTLLNDYRTTRLALSQAWRPAQGNDAYSVHLDHSRVRSSSGAEDTLTALRGTGLLQWTDQSLELGASYSLNRRSDTGDESRQALLSARHAFRPREGLQLESLASWNDLHLAAGGASSQLELDNRLVQLSTVASWRPQPDDWLYSAEAPLIATGTARLVESATGSSGTTQRSRALALSGGLTKDFSRTWRASASASLNRFETASGSTDQTIVGAVLLFTPDSVKLGEWRYAPSASANLNVADTPGGDQRQVLGLQGSHALARAWALDDFQTLSVNVAQSAGVLRESPSQTQSTGLSHSLGLFWQGASGSSQTYASATVSDSRTRSPGAGLYQFANLQLSRRSQLTRYSSWSANLTLQASRSSAEQLDAFIGVWRKQDNGWQRFTSGAMSYESQRVFGVPRLRFTALLSATSQQLEQRALGDVSAPLERVTESAEARLDYRIGLLDTRLATRVARVDGRTVAVLSARAVRRF